MARPPAREDLHRLEPLQFCLEFQAQLRGFFGRQPVRHLGKYGLPHAGVPFGP